jgi:hypothetical protein
MALTSTLGSPGVEIREVDNSLRLDTSTGTTVYIPGFAAQGPVDEVMSIGSMSDFETIYGVPTNAAERYFYYTVKSILDNTGGGTTVLCTRLPYGADSGDTISNQYTLMAYPAVPVIKKQYYKFTSETGWRISDSPDAKNGEIGEALTMPFDQFILTDDTAQSTLLDAFTINKVTELTDENDEVIYTVSDEVAHAELIDCVLTIDGDEAYETIEVVQVNSNSTDEKPVRVPAMGTTIDLTHFDDSTASIVAPEIKFNKVIKGEDGELLSEGEPELTAEGYMALEGTGKDDSTFLHLSYVIKKNVSDNTENPNEDKTPVGSLYIKLKYSSGSTDIENGVFTGLAITSTEDEIEGQSNEAIKIYFKSVEAHQIADTFTGLREGLDGTVSDNYAQDVTYIVGSPVSYQVSLNDYYKILTGEKLLWEDTPYDFQGRNEKVNDSTSDSVNPDSEFGQFNAIGHSAFIVLNTARTIINGDFEGFYLGITDNMFINPSDEYVFNAITSVKTTSATYNETEDKGYGLRDNFDNTCDYQSLAPSRLSCKLADNSSGAISKILARDIISLDISGTNYDDTISMGLFKLTSSQDDSDIPKLNCSLKEKYNWSFGASRYKSDVSSTKPVSYFAENVVEDSNNLSIMINPNITKKAYLDSNNNLHGKMRVFGTKLVDNLDKFETKYLRNNSLTSTASTGSVAALNVAKMSQMSIKEWGNIVAQAGVTPAFIKKYFKAYTAPSTSLIDINDEYGQFQPLNSLLPFGAYSEAESESKQVGEIPAKLERALSLVENDELYPDIDIVLESGLGTVYINAKGDMREDGEPTQGGLFDEAFVLKGLEDLRTGRSTISDLAQNVKENYLAVQNVFLKFANSYTNGGRGDCFYISDIPRGILIKGKDTKVTTLFGTQMEGTSYDLTEKVNHSFPTSVYYPINHTFDSIVSSYMSTYAQWVKILDNFTAKKVWQPISGYIAANMCATDTVYGPWYAAAGLRRGVINGVLDYAISPNVSQRTDLYKICINSVPKIPNYGVTIWGIRTMSKTASAFDQNTCRRTFLYMEKKVKQLLRYYLFEPNNSYTRLQIYNDIDPFLQSVKNGGGVYAYTLVCDTTINTPEVINNGDLAIRITAAPTRTAENIVVEFVANKYTEEIASSEG